MEGQSIQRKHVKITLAALGVVAVLGTLAVLSYPKSSASPDMIMTEELSFEHQEFKAYLLHHGKQYDSEAEYHSRLSIFTSNAAFIRLHNSQSSSLKMAVNKFADMTHEEFKQLYLGAKFDYVPKKQVNKVHQLFPSVVDWREQGKVTPVKDQKACGSCWAFSSTGAMESAIAIKKGVLKPLSEQQLVDCSWYYGNQGCNGGWMDQAFVYAARHGVTTEDSYPYRGTDGHCKFFKRDAKFTKLAGHADVTSGDFNALASAVAQQPVSVAVDATIWQFYSSGVVGSDPNDLACGTELNHGVLAVGFDMNQGFWTVKNSWGTDWGEEGYIRLSITSGDGTCGINMAASYPIVK